jgi:hypothetical protein
VEREGKKPIKGLMSVGRKMVTVSVGLRRKSAQIGGSPAIVVARRLLVELEGERRQLYD